MKKFNTANPGATPGGSFSAANADITDLSPFKKSNGRLSTPPMAKAPGGGTGTPKTGFLNWNLGTGPCSTLQKESLIGVILTGAVSMPPWIHGGLIQTVKMDGRPLMMQMERAHGGGTSILKTGSLSQNLGTGWRSLIL